MCLPLLSTFSLNFSGKRQKTLKKSNQIKSSQILKSIFLTKMHALNSDSPQQITKVVLQSLPQLLVRPLPEILEIPVRIDMLRSHNLHPLLRNQSKLHLIHRVAVPLIDDRPAFVQNLLALLSRPLRIPVVGDQGQPVVLRKSSSNPILLDMGAEKINTRQERLPIFVASHNKIVIKRVGLVPLLVAERSQVVGVLLNGVADPIIMKHILPGQLLQLTGGLLEIRELSSRSNNKIVRNLLEPVDAVIFQMKGEILSSPPQESMVSVARMTPSLHFSPMTAPPVTMGLVT